MPCLMSEITPVMVNGLPGKVANALACRIAKSEDFEVFSHSYTGPEIDRDHHNVDEQEVTLVRPNERDEFLRRVTIPKNLMVVDFVSPGNALVNAEHYCANRWNFLMGTTMSKADRAALEERVKASGVFALPAPNFAEQIVGFQKVVGRVANEYAGQAKGYTLNGLCTHQGTKKDVSGTWRNVARDFVKMGVTADINILDTFKVTPYEDAEIEIGVGSKLEVIRDTFSQVAAGVPVAHIKWHGHHSYEVVGTKENLVPLEGLSEAMFEFIAEDSEKVFGDYSLERGAGRVKRISRDGNVVISAEVVTPLIRRFEHKVNGGSVYVDGAMNGLRYGRDCIARGDMGVKSVFDVMAVRN